MSAVSAFLTLREEKIRLFAPVALRILQVHQTGQAVMNRAYANPEVALNRTLTIRELTEDEIHDLLTRNHVGRIAFSFHDRVDIRPIHYVYRDNWLYGRTEPSDKLVLLQHNQWVAFEVDEVHGPFDWESVVAHGSFYHLTDDSTPHNRETRNEALKLLREFVPQTFRKDDPVAFRTELFGIAIDHLTGRAASTR